MKLSTTHSAVKNETELVDRLRTGDEEAYQKIFTSYWPICFRRACAVLGDKEAAQEVVQEIFIHLWDKKNVLLIQNLQYYLLTAVKNSSLNYLRKQGIYCKHLAYYTQLLNACVNDTEEEILRNDLVKNFKNATKLLPSKSRQIIELSRLQGFTIPEIAKELKISVKVVEYHIQRSLNFIRKRLKEFAVLLIFILP